MKVYIVWRDTAAYIENMEWHCSDENISRLLNSYVGERNVGDPNPELTEAQKLEERLGVRIVKRVGKASHRNEPRGDNVKV